MPDITESTIYLQSIHVYIYNVDIFYDVGIFKFLGYIRCICRLVGMNT